MKLRLDLVKYITADDILEEAVASVHRYDPEPKFSKTGVGSLRSATPEERAEEDRRSEAFIARLKERARQSEAAGDKSP